MVKAYFAGTLGVHDERGRNEVVFVLVEAGEDAGERRVKLVELDAPGRDDAIQHVLVVAHDLAVLDELEGRVGRLGADRDLPVRLDFREVRGTRADREQSGRQRHRKPGELQPPARIHRQPPMSVRCVDPPAFGGRHSPQDPPPRVPSHRSAPRSPAAAASRPASLDSGDRKKVYLGYKIGQCGRAGLRKRRASAWEMRNPHRPEQEEPPP